MKTFYQLILVSALGVGSASAQLASDNPAPVAAPAAASANSRLAAKSNRLASEVDTMKAIKTTKAQVQENTRKLPSEAEAPRKDPAPKNKN